MGRRSVMAERSQDRQEEEESDQRSDPRWDPADDVVYIRVRDCPGVGWEIGWPLQGTFKPIEDLPPRPWEEPRE
jgi:hypothetical protein